MIQGLVFHLIVTMTLCGVCIHPGTTLAATQPAKPTKVEIEIKADGQHKEWIYENPMRYVFVHRTDRTEGKKAKKEVDAMVRFLHLHEKAKMEEMIPLLSKKYAHLEKVSIRLISEKNQLYTWTWDSQLKKELNKNENRYTEGN